MSLIVPEYEHDFHPLNNAICGLAKALSKAAENVIEIYRYLGPIRIHSEELAAVAGSCYPSSLSNHLKS